MRSAILLLALTLLFAITNSSRVQLSQWEDAANGTVVARHRVKRNLIFQPGTRIMFRVNTKDNIIRVSQIFAHGWGFRANIDLTQPDKPNLLPRVRRGVSRREIHGVLEELINQHGFSGKSCLSRLACDVSVREPKATDGIFTKMLRLIFKSAHDTGPQSTRTDCRKLHSECPLHLFEVSPFTDL